MVGAGQARDERMVRGWGGGDAKHAGAGADASENTGVVQPSVFSLGATAGEHPCGRHVLPALILSFCT